MAERIAQTLKGKTAIVTGGSRGLGTGLARELAARGACVLITYASSPKKAEEVVNEIQAANGSAKAIQADCENPDTAEKIVNLATTLLPSGKIDIIVNNAAFGDDLLIGDVSLDYWNKMLVTNLTFPFFLVKTALPHIAKGGRIVNISSTMAKEPWAESHAYAATKAALESVTRTLALEIAQKHDITINAVNPGPIDTEMWHDSPARLRLQSWVDSTPSGARAATMDDIAQIVGFLCEEKSRWVNGSVVCANGGLQML